MLKKGFAMSELSKWVLILVVMLILIIVIAQVSGKFDIGILRSIGG